MKVLPFQIPKPENSALIVQEDIEFEFYNKLHQHDEIQISYVVKGEGTILVGDTINNFNTGDLIVLGNNLPHVFKSIENRKEKSHMITLFFTKQSFGNHFFDLKELSESSSFFNQAKHGFKISKTKKEIVLLFDKIKKASKLERFILFLELLLQLTKTSSKSLSSFIYEKKYTQIEGKRMRAIFDYTLKNYSDPISLDNIADVASMTKNAFCKYFKKRTNKTYFRFLNEIRIAHACKIIAQEKETTLAEISFVCGFRNVSNFNRQFKAIKNCSPSYYRKK
ncbi:AraC family transcriptional regulator [Polaribacter tangerinus]|uniref:AraC family transcriptional regulator n=1 Tax=Polaribacter tangerinus TaxID=1920034 RepID=UPI000B4AB109|nr:AraC family transcriptional regulator [Polaribacter tangerinus]